jgi:hypothetical protein
LGANARRRGRGRGLAAVRDIEPLDIDVQPGVEVEAMHEGDVDRGGEAAKPAM